MQESKKIITPNLNLDPHERYLSLSSGTATLSICRNTGKVVSLVSPNPHGIAQEWLEQPYQPELRERNFQLEFKNSLSFNDDVAWGSDWCYPTISAFPPELRDHGEIWGRPVQLMHYTNTSIELGYCVFNGFFKVQIQSIEPSNESGVDAQFKFSLQFSESLQSSPWHHWFGLFAMHSLFQAQPGDVLEIRDHQSELARWVFPENQETQAQKFYVSGETLQAHWRRNSHRHALEISHGGLHGFGIWWCNGAWGRGTSRCVGIEPTNHLTDGPVWKKPSHSLDVTASAEVQWKLVST